MPLMSVGDACWLLACLWYAEFELKGIGAKGLVGMGGSGRSLAGLARFPGIEDGCSEAEELDETSTRAAWEVKGSDNGLVAGR